MAPRSVKFKASYWSFEEPSEDELHIYIGGMTRDRKTVLVRVTGFKPSVYLELPKHVSWNRYKCKELFEFFQRRMKSEGPLSFRMLEKEKLHYKKTVYTLCLDFPTHTAISRKFHRICANSKNLYIPGVGNFTGGDFLVHEQNIDPIIKFTAKQDIKLAGWIKATEDDIDFDLTEEERKFSTADIDMEVNWENVCPYEQKKIIITPLKYCSFDIECYSKNHNSKLPDPEIPENIIFMIIMIFGDVGCKESQMEMILLTLYDPKDIEGVETRRHKSEKHLLLDFSFLVSSKDPSLWIGYNIIKFDWHYMVCRARVNGIYPQFSKISRLIGVKAIQKKFTWSSSAYGQQEFMYLDCHGRTNMDVLPEIERNFRLPTYSLKAVSEYFLQDSKEDISARQLFMSVQLTQEIGPMVKKKVNIFQLRRIKKRIKEIFPLRQTHGVMKQLRRDLLDSTPGNIQKLVKKAIWICGVYCKKDGILPIRLAEKLNLWTTMEEMSNVMNVPTNYLHTRGQQIKVIAQLYRETMANNLIIPYKAYSDNIEKYQGAVVFKAVPGDYEKVCCLDFASLYPSIMIAYNICYTTLLEDDDPTPDSECHVLDWEDHIGCEHDPQKRKKKKDDVLCKHHHYRFRKMKIVLHKDGTVEYQNEGIMPRLERRLLSERKVFKKELFVGQVRLALHKGNSDPDDLKKYKFLGGEIIEKGSLSEKEVEVLEIVIAVADAKQKALKISANSVGPNTPIPCLIDGKFEYKMIEELFTKADIQEKDGNEICHANKNIKVWSDKGWTDIKYVIRHPVKKPLTRVLTHTGCVDVTSEHSLLNSEGMQVKTDEVSIGDALLHADYPLPSDTPQQPKLVKLSDEDIRSFDLKTTEEEEAFTLGLFFAEGTAGVYGTCPFIKSSWCIYNKDRKLLKRARDILNKVEENCTFKINDYGDYETFLPSGEKSQYHIYYLKPTGNVKPFVEKYRDMFYNSRKEKCIPTQILSSSYRVRLAFFVGYYSGDGNRHLSRGIVIQNKGQIGTAGLFYLAKSLGYKVSISYSQHNEDLFRLQCSTKFRNYDPDWVKSIEEAPQPPPISAILHNVKRNGVELVKGVDGTYDYKSIKIKCQRLPRQKLLDSLDEAQEKNKFRGRFSLYDTKTKKVTYKCDTCLRQDTIALRVLHAVESSNNVCHCKESSRFIEKEECKASEKKTIEYIYDIETKNHHFAAGVGNMIVHNSMYGAMGAQKGYIPLVPGAASITAMGRKLILLAVERTQMEIPSAVLVYGDTDSCMFLFEGKTLKESFALAKKASSLATHYIKCQIVGVDEEYCFTLKDTGKKIRLDRIDKDKHFDRLSKKDKIKFLEYQLTPIDLEFENMYGRFLLLTKKRYVAYVVNIDGKILSVTKKGVVLARRDNCEYLRATYKKMVTGVLDKIPEEEVMNIIYDRVNALFTRQIPDTQLIIYMGVKKITDYAKSKEIKQGTRVIDKLHIDKYGDPIEDLIGSLDPRLVYPNLPQVLLTLKMLDRGDDVPANTRLEFLYLQNKNAVHQGDKAEDYTYYKENKDIEDLRPDYLHYLEKQLSKPITELLTVKYSREPVAYEKLDDARLRCVRAIDDELISQRIARTRVFVKERPIRTSHDPDHETCVGWDALLPSIEKEWTAKRRVKWLDDQGNVHKTKGILKSEKPIRWGRVRRRFIKERERSISDMKRIWNEENEPFPEYFKQYTFKGNMAKVEYIIQSAKTPGKTEINPDKYSELIDACKKWKARMILNAHYRRAGLRIRPSKHPSRSGEELPAMYPVMLTRDISKYTKGSLCHTYGIYVKEKRGKKVLLCDYDILMKDGTVIKDLMRRDITTYLYRDSTIMKDILDARTNYKKVVDRLNKMNKITANVFKTVEDLDTSTDITYSSD
uniref:DNA polymerase n=1 Tax=Marseillevirus LCMAC101 TaxID=2506602 RepID=A0A481YRG8_9VIRU|nr:MAG: DNA polymerase elongation subunit family B [Marseillevirus LCMAC101]